MPKANKTSKSHSKCPASTSPLRVIVGDEVYDLWVKMLKHLMPAGRTHRLRVLVASMLAYASTLACADEGADDEHSPGHPLLLASEGVDDEEANTLLKPMLTQLFEDAGAPYERVNRQGERYSIIREATMEFCRWYNHRRE